MSHEYQDTYEELEVDGEYYHVEFTVVLDVEDVDIDPGPFCGQTDYGMAIYLDHVYLLDMENGGVIAEVDTNNPICKRIVQQLVKDYEPSDKQYARCRELAEEDHYSQYEEEY